jgi:hypothetical protein|nr:MAG TPA: hypothetical protein [Caudoviricetes sp.]
MKPTIGYFIYSVGCNAIVTFTIAVIMALYVIFGHPAYLDEYFRALWYTVSIDTVISCSVVICLKNLKHL